MRTKFLLGALVAAVPLLAIAGFAGRQATVSRRCRPPQGDGAVPRHRLARAEPNAVELPQVPPFGTGTCIENLNGDGRDGDPPSDSRTASTTGSSRRSRRRFSTRSETTAAYKLTGVEYIVASARAVPTLYGQGFDETNLAPYGNPGSDGLDAARVGVEAESRPGRGMFAPVEHARHLQLGGRRRCARSHCSASLRSLPPRSRRVAPAAAPATATPCPPCPATPPRSSRGPARARTCSRPRSTRRTSRSRRRNGYGVITQMIPDMGWHFMNPAYTKFDVTKPPILVYGSEVDVAARRLRVGVPAEAGRRTRSPERPTARSGLRATTRTARSSSRPPRTSAPKSPQSGAPFAFWHPDFVTLHLWVWYPNSDGIFSG